MHWCVLEIMICAGRRLTAMFALLTDRHSHNLSIMTSERHMRIASCISWTFCLPYALSATVLTAPYVSTSEACHYSSSCASYAYTYLSHQTQRPREIPERVASPCLDLLEEFRCGQLYNPVHSTSDISGRSFRPNARSVYGIISRRRFSHALGPPALPHSLTHIPSAILLSLRYSCLSLSSHSFDQPQCAQRLLS